MSATSTKPKKLLLWSGNETRAGLGGLGPGQRIYQDISVKERPQQAKEATHKVFNLLCAKLNFVLSLQITRPSLPFTGLLCPRFSPPWLLT